MFKSPVMDILTAPYDPIFDELQFRAAAAKTSIYAIHFTLGLSWLVNQMVRLNAIGGDVQAVGDLSMSVGIYERKYVQMLQTALRGKYVLGVSPKHHQIVHSKMVIIDHNWAWIGSSNLTPTSAYEQNIVTIMRDPAVIAALEAYFHQVFHDTQLHPSLLS